MFNWSKWPPEFTYSTKPQFPQEFPNLRPHLCVDGISGATRDYNCFAWAALDISRRWEPDPFFQWYWPDGVTREYTKRSYIEAFRAIGFEVCPDGTLQADTEKIAIYTVMGDPQHAARQLPNGNWTSKIGDFEDVQHVTPDAVSGPLYGKPDTYMSRPRKKS